MEFFQKPTVGEAFLRKKKYLDFGYKCTISFYTEESNFPRKRK